MSVKTDLNKLKKTWKKAEAREGFPTIPDDTYDCRIDAALIEKAKSTKRLQVSFQLTIVNGEHANKKLRKYDGLESEENIEWLKGSLASLDVEIPDDISELPDILASLEGTGCEVTVKTKDEFQNVYFNGPIELEAVDDDDEDEEEEDEEEDEDIDEEDEDEEDEDEDDDDDEDEEEDEDDDEDEDDEEEEEEVKKSRRKKAAPKKKAAAKKKKPAKKKPAKRKRK